MSVLAQASAESPPGAVLWEQDIICVSSIQSSPGFCSQTLLREGMVSCPQAIKKRRWLPLSFIFKASFVVCRPMEESHLQRDGAGFEHHKQGRQEDILCCRICKHAKKNWKLVILKRKNIERAGSKQTAQLHIFYQQMVVSGDGFSKVLSLKVGQRSKQQRN